MSDRRRAPRSRAARNLAAVRARIAAACAAAGRDPSELTLIAVTKTYPAPDVLALAGLGLTDFGENRDQEAAPKAAAVRRRRQPVTWHFIGQLQTNKAHSVAGYADFVHSVDRVRLVAGARRGGPRPPAATLTCLVQVSLRRRPAGRRRRRGGVPPARSPRSRRRSRPRRGSYSAG